MCGIAGIWSQVPLQLSQLNSISAAFLDSLRNRGPNDSGSHITHNSSLLLCHTRLSILDLSSLGHQPKQSFS